MSARDLVEEFGLNKDHCSLLRELCNGRAASSLMSGGGRACENNKENKLLLEELQTAGLVSRLAVTPSKKEIGLCAIPWCIHLSWPQCYE